MDVTRIQFGSEAFRHLLEAAKDAEAHGRDLSIANDEGWLKVKVGEAMWSPALTLKDGDGEGWS